MRGLSGEFRNDMESLSTIKEFVEVSNLQKARSHRNPSYSAMSIFLGGLDHLCAVVMRGTIKSRGYIPISLVYDGIYFGTPKRG